MGASMMRGGPQASFEEFDQQARAGKPLSVVFFGGSLTWGANASNPQRTSYRGLMEQYLRARYPHTPFTFHDAAIGGTGSQLGMFRWERDVLAYKPDLVFLDFTANDDLCGTDPQTLASYEHLLRVMIGRGIPVEQVFLGFQFNFGAQWHPDKLPRLMAHRQLAAAYQTAVGDAFPLVQQCLQSGRISMHQVWPFDGVHPDDPGYELFFEAVRDGFEQAVAQKRMCVLPDRPTFPDRYHKVDRIILVDRPLPQGWQRAKTYRTSMWFDGLSSRWIGDVAMCDVKDKAAIQPLTVQFRGTLVGLLGEADGDGLPFKVVVDGRPLLYRMDSKLAPSEVWPWNTKRLGGDRLFMWRVLSDTLVPGPHTLTLQVVFPEGQTKGQLRIESVCAAGD